MKFGNRLRAGLMMCLVCHAVVADEIAIEPHQIQNLGITLASPEPVERVGTSVVTAQVVIPPSRELVIAAPQSGLIVRLDATVGDEVSAGQIVAEIASPDFLSLQRDFLEALNEEQLSRSQLERDRELYDEGIIARRRLQETETRARIATARLGEQRQMLRIGGLADTEIRSLATRQELLGALSVRSPAAGVVLDLMVVTGERAEAMTPIYRVADLSSLWLELNVPQEEIGGIRPGMEVARSDSPGRAIAVIDLVGRAIDPETQSIKARATFIDPDHGLKPGQFISAQILSDCCADKKSSVWAVPTAAVARSGDGSYVFVRTAAGFDVREVRITGTDPGKAYIREGISAGDNIAISGVSALKALWASLRDDDA